MHSAAIFGCLGPRLRPEERAFFAEAQPWGFVLFARNIETPDQTRRLTAALRDAVGWAAPIFIEHEGGPVHRMGPPHWRAWLPPMEEVTRGGAPAMEMRARLMAHELCSVGIDVNCGPMLDIADLGTHPCLAGRCYGTDVEAVVASARAVISGLRAGGVLAAVKHIPGLGRAELDSQLDLPVIAASAEALRASDFAAFAAFQQAKLAIAAHVIYRAFDPKRPATQSRRMVRLIREEIGFRGLLIADDIAKDALDGALAERANLSRAAGCDVVLHSTGDLCEMQEVVGAVGGLDAVSEARADAALAERRAPDPIDIQALAREFDAGMAGQKKPGCAVS